MLHCAGGAGGAAQVSPRGAQRRGATFVPPPTPRFGVPGAGAPRQAPPGGVAHPRALGAALVDARQPRRRRCRRRRGRRRRRCGKGQAGGGRRATAAAPPPRLGVRLQLLIQLQLGFGLGLQHINELLLVGLRGRRPADSPRPQSSSCARQKRGAGAEGGRPRARRPLAHAVAVAGASARRRGRAPPRAIAPAAEPAAQWRSWALAAAAPPQGCSVRVAADRSGTALRQPGRWPQGRRPPGGSPGPAVPGPPRRGQQPARRTGTRFAATQALAKPAAGAGWRLGASPLAVAPPPLATSAPLGQERVR